MRSPILATIASSLYGTAQPPRSNPSRVSSSGRPGPCITPSSVTPFITIIFPILSPVLSISAAQTTDRDGRTHESRSLCTATGRPPTMRSESVRVFVLPPGARFGGLGFRRSLEQGVVVRRDERVGRRNGVGVVDGPVLAREGDPARVLAQTVLQLSPDLSRPLLEPVRRVVDHLLDLGNLLRLLLGQREAEVEREVAVVGRDVGELPAHPLLVGRQPLHRR